MMPDRLLGLVLLVLLVAQDSAAQEAPVVEMYTVKGGELTLTGDGASHLARLALDCIHKEYPN